MSHRLPSLDLAALDAARGGNDLAPGEQRTVTLRRRPATQAETREAHSLHRACLAVAAPNTRGTAAANAIRSWRGQQTYLTRADCDRMLGHDLTKYDAE